MLEERHIDIPLASPTPLYVEIGRRVAEECAVTQQPIGAGPDKHSRVLRLSSGPVPWYRIPCCLIGRKGGTASNKKLSHHNPSRLS